MGLTVVARSYSLASEKIKAGESSQGKCVEKCVNARRNSLAN